MKSKTIAIFDFDHTIITRDSLFDFIKNTNSPLSLIFKYLRVLPTLICNRLGIIPAKTAKEKLLSVFYGGQTKDTLEKTMGQYSLERIPHILNRQMTHKIAWHRRRHHILYIISSSLEGWILPWAKKEGFHSVLATKLSYSDGRFRGKFEGDNCKGPEKVRRFVKSVPNYRDYYIYVYSDNISDRPLFDLADKFERIGQ